MAVTPTRNSSIYNWSLSTGQSAPESKQRMDREGRTVFNFLLSSSDGRILGKTSVPSGQVVAALNQRIVGFNQFATICGTKSVRRSDNQA
jgi:hypothetical protein